MPRRACPPFPGVADGALRPLQHHLTLLGLQGVHKHMGVCGCTRGVCPHAEHAHVCVNTRVYTCTLRFEHQSSALSVTPAASPESLRPSGGQRPVVWPAVIWSHLAKDSLRSLRGVPERPLGREWQRGLLQVGCCPTPSPFTLSARSPAPSHLAGLPSWARLAGSQRHRWGQERWVPHCWGAPGTGP